MGASCASQRAFLRLREAKARTSPKISGSVRGFRHGTPLRLWGCAILSRNIFVLSWAIPPVRLALSERNSGKTPETLSELSRKFPSRVRLGCPKPYNSRHLRLPEHFQNYLPPSTAGGASFFRSGSGEGLSELVMEFPAVLRVSLISTLRSFWDATKARKTKQQEENRDGQHLKPVIVRPDHPHFPHFPRFRRPHFLNFPHFPRFRAGHFLGPLFFVWQER